jgi:L-cysteine/cystine lyase
MAIKSASNDHEKVALIRQAMPVTQKMVYLNTGTAGPLSTVTLEALHQANLFDSEIGRGNLNSFKPIIDALAHLREAFARLVKATAEEIALTHHTTDGMNIVSHGLRWHPGDEVITTTLEHEGGLFPLAVLRQRHGVVLKLVDIKPEDTSSDIVAKLEAAITPRTRLLAFSHVVWNTGFCFPMEEIVAMAHRHHVLTLVDAAQSVGAIALDLPASGVDFYAMPGQKWLCGIEGTGALYVRKDRISMLEPTFVGYLSAELGACDFLTGHFLPAKGAKRYEVGTTYRPGIKAMLANLRWLEESVGWEWIHQRIASLTAYSYNALKDIPQVSLITQAGSLSGLISFDLENYDPARVATQLGEKNIVLRFLPHPYCLRVSVGFYNTKAEIDYLIGELRAITEQEPEELPKFVPFY